MASPIPAELAEQVALLETTMRVALEPLGVEHVRVVAAGTLEKAKFWIGYRLRAGVTRTRREVREEVGIRMPAAVSYFMLTVCPLDELPDLSPDLIEARRALVRVTPWRVALLALLVVPAAAFLLGPLLFGRGALVAGAPLQGPGTAVARFVATEEGLTLWADLDGSWSRRLREGSRTLSDILPVHYEIDVVQGGQVVRHLSIDTQVPRLVSKHYCTVAPDCEIFLEELEPVPAGPVELRVTGSVRADVTRVDDMSLHVREATFF